MLKKSLFVAIVCVGIASLGFNSLKQETTIGGLVYTQGTEQLAKESIASGRPIVAYFTADWCVYCQVFKERVLEDPAVVQALAKVDRYIIDLTARNDPRWEWVRKLGGVGIPFFVIYKDGRLTATTDPNCIIKIING